MGALITYADFEALYIQLGAGVDTFTIETTILGRTVLRTGGGADVVRVKTIDGLTTVETEGGDDRVTVSSDTGVLNQLLALLTIDTGAGTDTVRLDDAAETNAETATINPTTVTGLGMGTGTPAGFAQRLTITGPTFVLYVLLADGTFQTTAPIAANATAATIQAALSAIVNPYSGSAFPFTDNVRVTRYGNVVELYFQGQYRTRGVAFAEGATVEQRRAGIDYYGVETLEILTGSGADVINVNGTSAATTIKTADGDDRVYVSSLAAFGLTDRPAYLRGDLNALAGSLTLDLGAGRHTLMISDEAATVGDTVVIDAVADAIRIAGLATGTITYRTDGTFADGITVWTGSGADTISISATHRAAGVRTVTFLNTGLGNDLVTVNLTAGEDDLLVLDTQGGVDHVLPLGGSDVASVSVDGLTLAPHHVGGLQRLRRPAQRARSRAPPSPSPGARRRSARTATGRRTRSRPAWI